MTMPETWDLFSTGDIGLALIGLAGFASVVIVMRTALGLNVRREVELKRKSKENQN